MVRRMRLIESRGKSIIFDFDGTLVDSLEVKYRARFEVFAQESVEVRNIAAQRIPELKGKLRSEIMRAVLEQAYPHFSVVELEQKVQEYVYAYDVLVEDRIVEQGLFPGVKELLQHLSRENQLFLNSGTPERALRSLTQRLNIDRYFFGIYGTDPYCAEGAQATKIKNMEKIKEKERVDSSDLIVIGDGIEDVESARAHGCVFIGVVSDRNAWADSPQSFPIVKRIDQIQDIQIDGGIACI